MRFDVVVAGGGTAGCVLAARLSENPDRHVCLVEAGPDYGPFSDERWPAEILDARVLPATHGWGTGGEDQRSLGGRLVGGSSAVNACMVIEGAPSDYDEWGDGWQYEELRKFLERAKTTLRTAPSNVARPSSFHIAFIETAVASGMPRLADPNDPGSPVGVAPYPANVVDGVRWNAAFAYLDDARGRSNLVVEPETPVARVELSEGRAVGVVIADGRRIDADLVVLTAGAYFSASILMRSGIGPPEALEPHGIGVVEPLPVGERLLDHYGTDVAWTLSDELQQEAARGDLFEPHAVVKAASSSCPDGSWDLHLLPWIYPTGDAGEFAASIIVFHMKPLSVGRLRLRSADPADLPLVERRFLSREEDLGPIVEGIATARELAATEPLRRLLDDETSPGGLAPEEYVRKTVRNYFHPAGTCAIGSVVDRDGRVLGVDGLVVADASIMPTIPRANTNLTTAAIAERIAETLGG